MPELGLSRVFVSPARGSGYGQEYAPFGAGYRETYRSEGYRYIGDGEIALCIGSSGDGDADGGTDNYSEKSECEGTLCLS